MPVPQGKITTSDLWKPKLEDVPLIEETEEEKKDA